MPARWQSSRIVIPAFDAVFSIFFSFMVLIRLRFKRNWLSFGVKLKLGRDVIHEAISIAISVVVVSHD